MSLLIRALGFAAGFLLVFSASCQFVLRQPAFRTVGKRQALIVSASAGHPLDATTTQWQSARWFRPEDLPADVIDPADVPALAGVPLARDCPGEILTWRHLTQGHPSRRAASECVSKVSAVIDELRLPEPDQSAVAAFAARQPFGPDYLEDSPRPLPGPDGRIEVLVAAEHIPLGALLPDRAVTTRSFPANLVTASFVPVSERDRIIGSLVVLPLEPDEPLLWQGLDDPDLPRSATACLTGARSAQQAALDAEIDKASDAWNRVQERR